MPKMTGARPHADGLPTFNCQLFSALPDWHWTGVAFGLGALFALKALRSVTLKHGDHISSNRDLLAFGGARAHANCLEALSWRGAGTAVRACDALWQPPPTIAHHLSEYFTDHHTRNCAAVNSKSLSP